MHRFTTSIIASSAIFIAAAAGVAGGEVDHGDCSAGTSCSACVDSLKAEPAPLTTAVGLAGYSPVSYIEKNRAEPGSPRFAAEHDGVTYFFTSERQRRMFQADPQRYLPAYGGYCAFGCSIDSKFVPDPESFEIIDGRTHLFLKNAEVDARALWREAKAEDVRAKADAYWSSQSRSRAYVGGRNVPASGVGLEGYSPVSYFTEGRAEHGDPRFAVTHNGVTYHLTSAEQVDLFQADPGRYEPQCGGWCAFGMSIQDKFPVDPTKFKIVDGRLYLFLNNDQVDAFELWEQGDEDALVRKAQAHWRSVSGE